MINSVFIVTDLKEKKSFKVEVEGAGQPSVLAVRKQFPKFSRFVLKGFVIDGVFRKLKIRRRWNG